MCDEKESLSPTQDIGLTGKMRGITTGPDIGLGAGPFGGGKLQSMLTRTSIKEKLEKRIFHHSDTINSATIALRILEKHPEFEDFLWLIDNRHQLDL